MKKQDALDGLDQLIGQWAKIRDVKYGQEKMPSFWEFVAWVRADGYGNYFEFRTTEGAMNAAQDLFDRKLGQMWRN